MWNATNMELFYTKIYKYMSFYANRGFKAKNSSPSFDYWSLMYTAKQTRDHPLIMKMGIKVLECKLTSVNNCVEVKHLRGSIDQGTLMYSQRLSMAIEPATNDCKSQGTQKMTLDSNPRINDLKSMG